MSYVIPLHGSPAVSWTTNIHPSILWHFVKYNLYQIRCDYPGLPYEPLSDELLEVVHFRFELALTKCPIVKSAASAGNRGSLIMIHQLIFAHPRPGMSEKHFQDYWINFHRLFRVQGDKLS